MKKLLAITALGVLTLTSCKKDYTCTCSSAASSYNFSETYPDQKKKDAEDLCTVRESQLKTLYTDAKCAL
jgi:hypothetical protein